MCYWYDYNILCKECFKQWWSTCPSILTKETITSHMEPLNIKNTTTYDVGNPGPGLGQAYKCGRVKLDNRIPTLTS